jgi:hypothetical protein
MSNDYMPHVSVLPEDDANRQLIVGFLLDPYLSFYRVNVLRVAGGWGKVLQRFQSTHIAEMRKNQNRFMILLIDFDKREGRFAKAKAVIPKDLEDRVFILGVWSEPEDLRKDGLGTYETIGQALAKDCREGTAMTWGHRLLCHNADELDRLRQQVCAILFPPI